MADRTLRILVLTTLVAFGSGAAARAEKLPEPAALLKDYDGKGIVQIFMPPRGAVTAKDGKKVVDPGFSTWFPFRQSYVNPNRILMMVNLLGALQSTLVQDNVERTYVPSAGYVIERTYKNLDRAEENPIGTVQLSMATYARVLRELDSGKLLPAEDLDLIKERSAKRIEELKALREKLSIDQRPEDEGLAQSAAAESARLRDELDQLDLRRAHPCHIIEFLNKDLVQNLFARGLMGESMTELIAKGKTTFWVTRAEGLPIKIETTANDGSVAVFMIFKELKINSGLHPGEVVLGNPPGTRLFRTTVDLKEKDWEQRMQDDLNAQISRYELDKQRQSQPLKPVIPPLKRPKK